MIDKVFNKTISKQFEFDEEVASVFDVYVRAFSSFL